LGDRSPCVETGGRSPAHVAFIFGTSVALDGNRIAVGAPGFTDEFVGAAYLFERPGGVWNEVGILQAPDAKQEDRFGWSIGLEGGMVVGSMPKLQGCAFDAIRL